MNSAPLLGKFRATTAMCAIALMALTTGACGSSGGGGTAGSSGSPGAGGSGNTGGSVSLAGPCSDATAVGHFTVSVMAASGGNDAYSQFGGSVSDKVSPRNKWTTEMTSGDCKLIVPPSFSCTPTCSTLGTECVGQNQCAASPVKKNVGTVTVTGLKSALSVEAGGNPLQYFKGIADYPPATTGAAITLSAAGGDLSPFTLHGQGIEPLTFPAPTMVIKDNTALPFTWTAAGQGSGTRILAELDFSHHGGTTAIVACDIADSGSSSIPATMVHALLGKGTSGFPTLTLTRRTVDSTTITAGCVDFAIAAPVEQPVMIEGITSCNCNPADCSQQAMPLPCPSGHTCRAPGTAGGLTCD